MSKNIIKERTEANVIQFMDKFLKYKMDDDWFTLFLHSYDDEYIKIRFEKDSGWCYVNQDFLDFMEQFLSADKSTVWYGVVKWCKQNISEEIKYFYPPHSIRRTKFLFGNFK